MVDTFHSLIRLPMPSECLASLSRASLRTALVASLVWHASLAASAQPFAPPAPVSIATVALHVEPPTQASPVVPVPPSEQYPALYRDVQLAHLFPDSKTFADMVPLSPPAQIATAYDAAKQQPNSCRRRS